MIPPGDVTNCVSVDEPMLIEGMKKSQGFNWELPGRCYRERWRDRYLFIVVWRNIVANDTILGSSIKPFQYQCSKGYHPIVALF